MKRYTVKRRYKKLKKRAAASAIAGLTALGILLGGSFESPAELLGDSAVPTMSDTVLDNSSDDSGEGDGVFPGEERRKGIRVRVWERTMALPYYVRAFVGVPLWCVGWLILSAVGLAWEPVLSPILRVLADVLCVSAVLLGTLTATVKAAFPDMPIKKILNRRSLFTVFFGALIFGAAGALMQIFLPEYDRLCDIAEGMVILAVLAAAAVPLLRKEARRRRDAAQIAVNTVPRKMDKKRVMELADSVSR